MLYHSRVRLQFSEQAVLGGSGTEILAPHAVSITGAIVGAAKMSKSLFLVVYDYGTGGVWRVFRARSPNEIVARYPRLQVVSTQPPWMSDESYSKEVDKAYDIDQPPDEWLRSMQYER
jgi:hypothetical protein